MLVEAPQVSMLDRCREIRRLCKKDGFVAGAEYILQHFTNNETKIVYDEQEAVNIIRHLIGSFLLKRKYKAACAILWGDEIFNTNPRSARLIWENIEKNATLLVMGAGAMSKSYSIAVWIVLDWLADPTGTCVKIVSVTKEHAKTNVLAYIKNLLHSALIPITCDSASSTINFEEDGHKDDKQGIHLVAIPQGDTGANRIKGFHPVPRGFEHPQFGPNTRIRVVLDEAEDIPEGVWADINNILTAISGTELIKIIGATNPANQDSKFASNAEPKDGWDIFDIETSDVWDSKLGWRVVRLDGAKCENVAEGRNIYPGMLTKQGYDRYCVMGDTNPEYYTMARGCYPQKGVAAHIIPMEYVGLARGHYTFYSKTTYCAAVDLAFEGGDRTVLTVGKFGRATDWYRGGIGSRFKDPKYVLQIEHQFELPKLKTLEMTELIIQNCKNLGIEPAWLIVDRTGNGTGVHDALTTMFGEEVIGLHFGKESTEMRVLQDDTQSAHELYEGVVTELWFSMRKFIEFNYLKFSETLNITDGLLHELTSRKFKQVTKGRLRVESKGEYKSRGNKSCDRADSLSLLVHLIRMRSEHAPMMLELVPDPRPRKAHVGIVDKIDYIDFSED